MVTQNARYIYFSGNVPNLIDDWRPHSCLQRPKWDIHPVPSGWITWAGTTWHGPLTRYVKLRVAHAPGMPGTFSPPVWVNDPDMHHGTCVTHVSWCMPGSLTSGFHWGRQREQRPRHFQRMCNAQFYVSGKRSVAALSVPSFWWKDVQMYPQY